MIEADNEAIFRNNKDFRSESFFGHRFVSRLHFSPGTGTNQLRVVVTDVFDWIVVVVDAAVALGARVFFHLFLASRFPWS